MRLSMLWRVSMFGLPEPAGGLGCSWPAGAGVGVAIMVEEGATAGKGVSGRCEDARRALTAAGLMQVRRRGSAA
jgi:hypothetical protein